ncbi:CBS domain-containing protein [Evansella cellulosilytica]|uniref:CBS domain containing protein n=1 Tax=Evansella cellulosilytica (strain ATCC 21833 / DSM 2522 / FERM P-1141 / JCM 9156 / N-4) TaxID=649639 RepID=E6TUJ1_EVAC2|nr:CBS domain-containing protein [Evansella cellulosilytica]ADU30881.1 CBS domain containing protein [Evansella cellulosilytica DSM 2522]
MKKLRDIMTGDVEICNPDDNVYEAALKMKQFDVGAIPICEGRQLLGMITDRDIVVRGVAEKRPNSTQVTDVMTEQLLTAEPDMTVDDAAKMMAEKQIRRLPIVENSQLVGIVALGDLAIHTTTADEAGYALSEISESEHYHH